MGVPVIGVAMGTGTVAAHAAAATERMRCVLGELMEAASMAMSEMGLRISEPRDRVDVRAMLSGKRALELAQLLAALDVLAVEPRRFFSQVWSEPAAASPLMGRLRRMREQAVEGWLEALCTAQSGAVERAPAAGPLSPREVTERVRELIRKLLAVAEMPRIEMSRRLLAEGVPVDTVRVLKGGLRLRMFDLIAILDVLELHPRELVGMVWANVGRVQLRDEVDGYPGGLLRQVD